MRLSLLTQAVDRLLNAHPFVYTRREVFQLSYGWINSGHAYRAHERAFSVSRRRAKGPTPQSRLSDDQKIMAGRRRLFTSTLHSQLARGRYLLDEQGRLALAPEAIVGERRYPKKRKPAGEGTRPKKRKPAGEGAREEVLSDARREARTRLRRPAKEGMAWCGRCQIYRPTTHFWPKRIETQFGRKLGWQSHCKECQAEAHRRRQQRRAEALRDARPRHRGPVAFGGG